MIKVSQREAILSNDSQNVISVCWKSMENNLEKGRFFNGSRFILAKWNNA